MQLGMIGLGRMGGNMVRRLMKAGTSASSTTAQPTRCAPSPAKAPSASTSLDDFVGQLTRLASSG